MIRPVAWTRLRSSGAVHGHFHDDLGIKFALHRLNAACTERLSRWCSATLDAKLGEQTEQLHDLAGPSIMPQTLQTAAAATGQPVAAPPVRC